jgi:hypothetical protein
MKKIAFFLFLSLNFSLLAQKSYYFGTPVPPSQNTVANVSPNLFGTYENEESPIDFEISAEGIITVSIAYGSISRETLRESTKYSVRNNYIFGIKEGDSLPCFLEGDKYIFGVMNKEFISGSTSKNVLIKLNENTYMVNFYENGKYTPCLLTFSGKTLSVRYFDYTSDTKAFDKILNQKTTIEGMLQNIVLEPSAPEWAKLNLNDYLGKPIVYTRK